MSFKLAANLAFKEGMKQGGAVLLEPVGALKVSIPTSYSGDIMGDISKRRGRIMGMAESGRKGWTVIEAEVPSAEMSSYAVQLRAMTQGRGEYSFEFCQVRGSAGGGRRKGDRGGKEGSGSRISCLLIRDYGLFRYGRQSSDINASLLRTSVLKSK